MCGICGIAVRDEARGVDPHVVRHMADAIVHRGPDDDGYFFDGPVGLGMRRLAIIDLAGGRQPIANEEGTVTLVYNGEIYNHRALRAELKRAGHLFATHSDTEVIVHAYEDAGADALRRLRGMFGLALWDARQRELLLAVDRFGIKPLYFAERAGDIAFGSSLGCVMRSGLPGRVLDLDGLAQYFTFGYIPPPLTVFSGVRKLEPGTLLRWSPHRGARIERYWELPDASPAPRVDADARAELLRALEDAVRSHLVSDVPVGAFLSGGVDSSAIVALASRVATQPLKTFSLGFADPRYSELDRARLVARRYATEHHELVLEPESVELLPTLAAHFGEPFADSSALPTYHVSKLAREHVKVVLSGDGGDELFLGYTLFRGLKLAHLAQRLPAAVRDAIGGLPARMPRHRDTARADRLDAWFKRVADSMIAPDLAFKRKLSMPGLDAVGPMLSPELRASLEPRDPFAVVDRWLRAGAGDEAHVLQRFVSAGVHTSLPGDMLVKVDRMSMANSLEVRVPLLDHVLAEHAAAIPIDQRMPGWRLKGLLRDTLAELVSAEILNAPKRGFVVPLAAWFRGDLPSFAREVLVSVDADRRGLLDTAAIESMLRRHEAGKGNLGPVIWNLLMFELWCQEELDR